MRWLVARMLAIDTNIVVRLLTDDDAAQTSKVRGLIVEHEVFVATTVILETAWVMGSTYRHSRSEVHHALSAFVRLANVRLEEPERIEQALIWLQQGMDFADALHLARTQGCEAFVTFDRPLSRLARRIDAGSVTLL